MVLVTNDAALVGDGNYKVSVLIEFALAGKA